MKNLKSSIIAITIAFCMTGCLESTHNHKDNQLYKAATTLSKEDAEQFIFNSDDGMKLIPVNDLEIDENRIGKRFYINFKIDEEYEKERIISLIEQPQEMISDSIRKDYENIGNVGKDMINPSLIWCSGKYLNIIGYIYASGKKKHDYHLFEKSYDKKKVELELRHDSHNDPKNLEYRQAFSYDIKRYLDNCEKDTLTISIKMEMPKSPNKPNKQEDIVILCPTHNNTKGFSALK